jgi:hypothetical protein
MDLITAATPALAAMTMPPTAVITWAVLEASNDLCSTASSTPDGEPPEPRRP